jgi:hypothetical protein
MIVNQTEYFGLAIVVILHSLLVYFCGSSSLAFLYRPNDKYLILPHVILVFVLFELFVSYIIYGGSLYTIETAYSKLKDNHGNLVPIPNPTIQCTETLKTYFITIFTFGVLLTLGLYIPKELIGNETIKTVYYWIVSACTILLIILSGFQLNETNNLYRDSKNINV